MSYRLLVNQQWKIAVALIFCPMLLMVTFFSILLPIDNLPDWAVYLAVTLMVVFSISVTLFIVFKWLTVECAIFIDEQSFHFRLLRETPFMHLHEFTCNWSNIENVAIGMNHSNKRFYYSIHFRDSGLALYLDDPLTKKEALTQPSPFWYALNDYVQRYHNSTEAAGMKITDTGFYERPWAKVFIYFIITCSILLLGFIIFIPQEVSWWRFSLFFIYTGSWIAGYYFALRKRKQKNRQS